MNPFIQTMTRSEVSFLGTDPRDIRLEDIIHALPRIPRFTAHAVGPWPWTVADHLLLCLELAQKVCPTDRKLHASVLVHDFHEAYIGDISNPLKRTISIVAGKDVLKEIEGYLDAAIHEAIGFTPEPDHADVVHEIDMLALSIETDQLMGGPSGYWEGLPAVPSDAPKLVCRPWHAVQSSFHDAVHRTLTAARGMVS